jgi:hypothetical protein
VWDRHECLYLVKAIQSGRYLTGNNRGGITGWVGRRAIFGRATRIERGHR